MYVDLKTQKACVCVCFFSCASVYIFIYVLELDLVGKKREGGRAKKILGLVCLANCGKVNILNGGDIPN